MQKLMLIDGNSIISRAFYGIPLLSTKEGIYTNAVYGFLNIFFKLTESEMPDYVAVTFDVKAKTFRHELYSDYKGTRKPMPEELSPQIPLLKEVLSKMGIKQYELAGFEADDLLGTLSRLSEEAGFETVVVSGDRDLLQLASDTLKIKIPKTVHGKTTVEDYYLNDVVEKYDVTPQEFIDVKALMGDSSDNIPGVPSIGEKTAVKIIKEFKTVENAIENAESITPKRAKENLIANKDLAILCKKLATIDRNAPVLLDIENMRYENDINDETLELFKKLEFKSLIQKAEKDSSKKTSSFSYSYIKTKEEFEDAIKKTDDVSSFILKQQNDDIFFALSCKKGTLYAETGKNIPKENFLDILKIYFENDNLKKISFHLKEAIKFLKIFNIEIKGVVFDAEIAAYILDPIESAYGHEVLAKKYLFETIPSEEEILGKGKSKLTLKNLTTEKRGEYISQISDIVYRAKPVMEDEIKKNDQEYLFNQIEMPLIYVLADMEMEGVKVDSNMLNEYHNELSDSISEVTKEIYALAGEEFNINSPKQLGVILFEKLGLRGGKKTKSGGYSTGAEILESLKDENPIIEKILYFRQLSKLKSTYADGLLSVTDKNTGKIYSTFNQTVTATGRISSTEPNLQNIPVKLELGRKFRKVFKATDENRILIDADYSQIELRVLADISGDETLIDAFKHNMDIHRLTASQVFGVPFSEVTPLMRSNAKAVNFGIVYGIGAFSLSKDIGTTRKEAENYIKSYFKTYPKIKEYLDTTIENAKKDGYVSTIFKRRRYMPELNAQNFNEKAFGERVAMNMPIQGTAADIIKIAMIKVHKKLKIGNFKSKLVLQVHDELIIDAFKDEKEEVYNILKTEMENAVDLKVPLDVSIESGENWFDTK